MKNSTKETIETITATNALKKADLKKIKTLQKTARDLKRASKKMVKYENEYNNRVKIKKIELLKDLGIYNESYDLESSLYDYMLETENTKETLAHIKYLAEDNQEKYQQRINLLEWNLIQNRSVYTLELLKDINVSIFENGYLCDKAYKKLEASPKVFLNLNLLYDNLIKGFNNDNHLTLLLLTKFFKFIIDSDIDSNYYFIYHLSEAIMDTKDDKTLARVMKENLNKIVMG